MKQSTGWFTVNKELEVINLQVSKVNRGCHKSLPFFLNYFLKELSYCETTRLCLFVFIMIQLFLEGCYFPTLKKGADVKNILLSNKMTNNVHSVR